MDETVGARVQRLAREQGKPAGKALAAALGVHYESLRQWTAGIGMPSQKRARVIADYLGVSVNTVMYGAAPPPRQPDAEAIADAFNALPTDTAQALDRRQWLYTSIMSQIAAHGAAPASAPAPRPAALPTPTPPPAK